MITSDCSITNPMMAKVPALILRGNSKDIAPTSFKFLLFLFSSCDLSENDYKDKEIVVNVLLFNKMIRRKNKSDTNYVGKLIRRDFKYFYNGSEYNIIKHFRYSKGNAYVIFDSYFLDAIKVDNDFINMDVRPIINIQENKSKYPLIMYPFFYEAVERSDDKIIKDTVPLAMLKEKFGINKKYAASALKRYLFEKTSIVYREDENVNFYMTYEMNYKENSVNIYLGSKDKFSSYEEFFNEVFGGSKEIESPKKEKIKTKKVEKVIDNTPYELYNNNKTTCNPIVLLLSVFVGGIIGGILSTLVFHP